MKIFVTGSNGFIGKNLIEKLKEIGGYEIVLIDRENSKYRIKSEVLTSDFVFHLAGINRPEMEEEFIEGNSGLTSELLELLEAT